MARNTPSQLDPAVLASLARPLPDRVSSMLARYVDLLLLANTRLNLTSIRERLPAQRRHIGESLALLRLIERAQLLPPDGQLLDLGSGGGLPGIPIAIVRPEVPITLLEATGKKAAFLSDAVAALHLANVAVVTARAEEAAHRPELRERFAVVVARAVAPLPALAELALPFADVGGCVLAVKGSRWQEELAEAEAALRLCGGEQAGVEPLAAGDDSALVAVRLNKVRTTPSTYPRRSGLPTRHPLSQTRPRGIG